MIAVRASATAAAGPPASRVFVSDAPASVRTWAGAAAASARSELGRGAQARGSSGAGPPGAVGFLGAHDAVPGPDPGAQPEISRRRWRRWRRRPGEEDRPGEREGAEG